MTTTTTLRTAASPIGSSSHLTALHERRFFGGMAIALTLVVFAGFSRTYYFNDLVATPFEMTPLLHWHGAVFSAWMLLLVAQTVLIGQGRVAIHRQLGIVGAGLAMLMVVLGMTVAVVRTADGTIADNGAPPLVFLSVPLFGMVVFAGLVGAALLLRRRSQAHKRLMLIATCELVAAGVARLPTVDTWGPVGFFGVSDVFIVAIVCYDLVTLRRIHPATIWGGLAFVLSQPLRLAIGASAPWLSFAAWLTT
jgi:hypothetical protein